MLPCSPRRAAALLFTLSSLAANTAIPGESTPPEYTVDVWNIQDGLPHSTVTGIVQTPDGYLWCSTHDGVVRFDGVRFVRIGPNDRASMQASHILSLHVDQAGALCLGTDGAGLLRYSNGAFRAAAEDPGLSTNSVFAIVPDPSGALWLGTRSGLARMSQGKVAWFTKANGLQNAPADARSIALDRDGQLWVADSLSLKVLRDRSFTTVFPGSEARSQRIWAVAHDGAGNTWAGSMNSRIWRGRDGQWTSVDGIGTLPFPDPVIFRETRSGDFWVGTRKGLFRCRNGDWKRFGTEDGMVSPDVRAIFEDREGNLWIGTSAGGLARFKRRLVTAFTARNGLSDERVQALSEAPDGGLFVGLSRGGLLGGTAGNFQPCDWAAALPGDAPVTSVLTSRDGARWVGTFGNKLWRFTDGSLVSVDADPSYRAAADSITAVLEDRAGNIWVGTYLGLRKVSGRKLVGALVDGRYYRSHVTALLQDRAGGLWVAFHGVGLVRVFKDQAKWLTRQEGLPTDFVRTLLEDRDGRLWIGTAAGLCCWSDGKVRTFSRAQGLVDEVISQILEDDAGNLWLGSNQGLMQIAKPNLDAVLQGRKSALEVFACGRGEGMPSVECSGGFSPAGLKTRDGRLWFPTAKGLVMVDPSQLRRESNPLTPPVYVEEVWIDGKIAATAPLLNVTPEMSRSPLQVPAGTRRLEFVYSGLSLTAPERVRFKHRLEGLDPDWTDADDARSASYPKLPPGNYRFQVIACNNYGVWNEAGAGVALSVLPQFWQTRWFIAMAAIAGFSVVGGTVRFFEKRKLQLKLDRLERQQVVERERARIARDIHDDLGASLTRITLLSQSLRDGHGENGASSADVDQIYDTARDLTRAMDEIVWAVNPQHDTLDSLVTYLGKFAQDFLRVAGVRCRLDLPVQLPAWPLTSEVRHGLFLAFKEALHNAVKHASATEIWIRLAMENGAFTLSVEDNGTGFEAGAPGSGGTAPGRIMAGHGLKNLQQRLLELGGRCETESVPARGTRVNLVVSNAAWKIGNVS